MSENKMLRIRLTLVGRPVRSQTFDKDVITVGRDPEADIFLDNPGISREHLRFERQPNGDYMLVDLGSANGTFLNDNRAEMIVVNDDDVVRIGKFSMWVGYTDDRRANLPAPPPMPIDSQQATVMLSGAEMEMVMNRAREIESAAPPEIRMSRQGVQTGAYTVPVQRVQASNVIAVVLAWLAGTALGAAAFWWLLKN